VALSAVGLVTQHHGMAVLRTDLASAVAQRDAVRADIRSQTPASNFMRAEATAAAARVRTVETKARSVGKHQKTLPSARLVAAFLLLYRLAPRQQWPQC
jgi:hypothetical protein